MALCLATLTLWIPAYWPVALFEISVFLIAGIALVLKRGPASGTHFPLFALSFIVLWGCFQLITGWTVDRFATERATLQWMTWAAVYYIGVSTLKDESLAKLLRTVIVWFGFAVAVEAILQAYLSPGKAYGLFPTGYHDFVMGPIVYHTHFAVFIETILPIALFLAFSEARESYTFLGISAVLLTAVVVSASRGGLIIAFAEVLGRFASVAFAESQGGPETRVPRHWRLVGVTAVLTLIVGFETASERFYSEALDRGASSVRRLHVAHDSRASLDWLGTGMLACGVSCLRHVRPRGHRQPGPLRLVAVGCGRRVAGRARHALLSQFGVSGQRFGPSGESA